MLEVAVPIKINIDTLVDYLENEMIMTLENDDLPCTWDDLAEGTRQTIVSEVTKKLDEKYNIYKL